MDKKRRYVSLRLRIILSTLIPVIASLFLISSINHFSLFNSFNEAAKANFLQTSQKYATSFERKINDAVNYLSIISSTLEMQVKTDSVDREMLQRTIWNIFNDYKRIDGSSIYFETDTYDGKDSLYIASQYGTAKSGRICWYFYTDGGKTAYLPEGLQNDIEFSLPHYTEAKRLNKPIYTETATYEIDGKKIPMFTITYPINDKNNQFIGAVTVDLFLNDIYAQLQNEHIYETGYVIIANDKDQVIYSPRFEDIGKSRTEAGLNYELSPNANSFTFFNAKSIINGKDTLVTFEPIYIPQLDSYFYISVAAPLEEINAGGARVMTGIVIFSVIIVIAIALLLYFLIGKISAPIKEITENADKIARGDYNARIKGDYQGELAVVKDSVNKMADSIETYIAEAKNSLDILKNILNGLDAFIYVTSPATGEILFVNENMKKHFNIEGECIGQLCYRVFHGETAKRCEFCPGHQLDKDPGQIIVWEKYNPVTKRFYRNTSCYINWHGGMKAHLQHSVDITDINAAMEDKLSAERQALKLKHEKEKAEDAARAKTEFLAKMSHEIRTPMNAVMGMSEIMLRKNLPQDVYENALGIKNASANLLSIINDILDFSKIESGMLEIAETPYMLSSLINDVASIIRVRLIDKSVHFTVDIDPAIPSNLIGDEIRIRQTLINLLSNAVKYTNEGYISLTVRGDISGNTATLTLDVADSGIGVKEEDIGKLFGNFVQVDATKNKGVEGTGLGLAISRSLCRLMGGDITVRSEYGKGSTFSITLPQKFESYEPFAMVDEPEGKSVLLYDTRSIYRDSVALSLKKLGVDCLIIETIPALFDNLAKFSYVFVASFTYGSISPALKKIENPPILVLLSDITETLAPKDATILVMPANPLSIANILNGVHNTYNEASVSGASFVAPDAKVLIVDDIAANLKVAEGLLLPYEMQTTLCTSGKEALELVSANNYDLIFMDHMMPEMDGIETTRLIREMGGEYFESLPIIALTANAVSGVREMFIQSGMNDFLAKPIETAKLDAVLGKWIPKNKRKTKDSPAEPETESNFVKMLRDVPELSVDKALSVVVDSPETYERIIKLSVRLIPENIAKLDRLIDTDLVNYSIEAHGIKGVLNNIGAYRLGLTALTLEESSKSGDLDTCKKIHPGFIKELTEFSNSIMALMNETEGCAKLDGDKSLLREAMPQLEEAADYFDSALALKILTPIHELTYGQTLDALVVGLINAYERFDFDKALELLEDLKGEL